MKQQPSSVDASTESKQALLEKQRKETETKLKCIDDCLAQAQSAFAENADKEVVFVLQTHALSQQIANTEALLADLKKQLSDSQEQLSKIQAARQHLTDAMCQLTEQRASCVSALNTF